MGSSACGACQAGTYNERDGQEGCTPCGAGFFSEATAATSSKDCLACPAGHLCLAASTAAPVPCSGSLAVNAAAAGPDGGAPGGGAAGGCKTCGRFFQANAGASGCTPRPIFLAFLAIGVVGMVAVAAVVAKKRVGAVDTKSGLDISNVFKGPTTVLDYGTI